jgi:thymidine phosphorylase
MNDQDHNPYGAALDALERVPNIAVPPTDPSEFLAYTQVQAQIAAAKANLALCDAIYHLRDHIEALPARLRREQ